MGQPYKNNKIRETIKTLLNLEMYQDKVPAEIEERVQLVIDVNPLRNEICDIVVNGTASNSTSSTIYTTPTDKEFYLTSATLSIIKDVTSTSTLSTISAVIKGSTINILAIPGITLTVEQNSISNNYSFPLLIDKGTNITVTNGTNVATVIAKGTITGFTSDSLIYDMGIGAQK